ncbi:MAG TPA: hypothetical protein QF625_06080 [Candidatus Scalindua sp.]|nr:hypothetical protein [Candidatus Scalindua sp.]
MPELTDETEPEFEEKATVTLVEDKNEKQKCRLKDKKRITNIEQGISNDY